MERGPASPRDLRGSQRSDPTAPDRDVLLNTSNSGIQKSPSSRAKVNSTQTVRGVRGVCQKLIVDKGRRNLRPVWSRRQSQTYPSSDVLTPETCRTLPRTPTPDVVFTRVAKSRGRGEKGIPRLR